MGSNIYSDLLPYKDWLLINNAIRCHEFGYEQSVVLLPNAFICSFKLPRFTCSILFFYLCLRSAHVIGYHSYRGQNGAFVTEEFLKLLSVIMILGAMSSSVLMSGLRMPRKLF